MDQNQIHILKMIRSSGTTDFEDKKPTPTVSWTTTKKNYRSKSDSAHLTRQLPGRQDTALFAGIPPHIKSPGKSPCENLHGRTEIRDLMHVGWPSASVITLKGKKW